MNRLTLLMAVSIFGAVPAYAAGNVIYEMYLDGAAKSTLVFRVDTHALPTNGVIRPAPFTAVIERADGSSVRQYYRFNALLAGKVYEMRRPHGVGGARSAYASDIVWGLDASGGKADHGGIQVRVGATTDAIGAAISPPPAVITHCQAYTRIAIQQFNDARNRQCGFTGNRWSADYQHHYQWCVGVLVPDSNAETQARATAISQCAAHH